MLPLNLFGVDERERFGLSARVHKGGPPIDGMRPEQLYEALRGVAHAVRMAAPGSMTTLPVSKA